MIYKKPIAIQAWRANCDSNFSRSRDACVQIPLDFQIFLDADGKERLRPSLNAINSVTATLDVGLLTADGVAALLSDTTDTFAYLRIVSGTSIDTAQPLKGVTVELLELDFPAPADDDVVVPATGETVVKTGKFLIDTVTSYEPQRDQVLSTQVTDNFGFARFVGVVNRLGGIFTTIRTWENLMEQ